MKILFCRKPLLYKNLLLLHSFIIKDDWHLLLELYKIQNELTNIQQPLEKFLPWGKLILKDFDECDKYLVDAAQLFSVLKAHKEIDETAFSISEETKKYIEQFIFTTSTNEKESIYKDATSLKHGVCLEKCMII
jgi:hypothetical protein